MAGRHDEVVARYGGLAQQVANEYGIDPRILLAQIIQEGNVKGAPGNNVMNLTAGSKWTGTIVNRGDTDAAGRKIKQNFRAYGSEEEGIRDYARMFATSDRYKGLRSGTTAERAAACALREDVSWMRELAAKAVENRERFADALRANGLAPMPSAANFLLVPIANAALVAQRMRERGIAVRPYPELPGIGDALRITIGPWAVMELALGALLAARPAAAETPERTG